MNGVVQTSDRADLQSHVKIPDAEYRESSCLGYPHESTAFFLEKR